LKNAHGEQAEPAGVQSALDVGSPDDDVAIGLAVRLKSEEPDAELMVCVAIASVVAPSVINPAGTHTCRGVPG